MSDTRYEDEGQIIKDIERTLKRISRYRKKAISVEANTDFLVRKNDPCLSGMIEDGRKKVKYCAMMANRLQDNTLVTLKDILAEFRTPQIGALDNGDKSLPRPKSLRPRKKISPQVSVPSEPVSMANEQPTVPDSPVSTLTVEGSNI